MDPVKGMDMKRDICMSGQCLPWMCSTEEKDRTTQLVDTGQPSATLVLAHEQRTMVAGVEALHRPHSLRRM